MIELVVSGTQLGRPLATTPGTPPERVAALRATFAAAMKDAGDSWPRRSAPISR